MCGCLKEQLHVPSPPPALESLAERGEKGKAGLGRRMPQPSPEGWRLRKSVSGQLWNWAGLKYLFFVHPYCRPPGFFSTLTSSTLGLSRRGHHKILSPKSSSIQRERSDSGLEFQTPKEWWYPFGHRRNPGLALLCSMVDPKARFPGLTLDIFFSCTFSAGGSVAGHPSRTWHSFIFLPTKQGAVKDLDSCESTWQNRTIPWKTIAWVIDYSLPLRWDHA